MKIFIITFLFTFGSLDQVNDSVLTKKQNIINEDFDHFWLKFSTDKSFHYSRILFPLMLFTENDQGYPIIKKYNRNKWKFIDFINIKKEQKNNDIKIVIESKVKVKVIYTKEDTGFYLVHHFIIKEGKWYLKKVTNESD